MEFVALDLETANPQMKSICQIGLARYRDGEVVDTWKSLVDPQDYFDPVNVSIHGIDEEDVTGSPTFEEIYPILCQWLSGGIAACHTSFDRIAITQASKASSLSLIDCSWLDSSKVTRRAWEEFAYKGYGLKNVCAKIGFEFQHHDALEDAIACGKVLLAAMDRLNTDIEGLLKRAKLPIDPENSLETWKGETGNPEGPLHGEVMVFTGALANSRIEAARLAAQIGCDVGKGVTKKTTMLVVGDQDLRALNGANLSSKHRKALTLIESGQQIKILNESDFYSLIEAYGEQ
ncbi:exonuclease domain-containing protein [Aestuariibacter salexigens]|uniref:exonuclease domain-containing protein n=1 Tax=Aestuariibacter salexigens TaxID=226010 RepID=UPI00041C074A|nr:exonuclease domain-containing protein [Aestuariibacter salexigens]